MTDQEILGAAMAYTDKHGGGGGGTTNYNELDNKPKVAGTTLSGDKSLEDLGIASATDLSTLSGTVANKVDKVEGKGLSENDYTDADKAIVGGVTSALQSKVDKVEGYGLSENNYSDADKTIVGGVTTALAGKVDKVEGKGLSENDYTDSDKAIVDGVTTALALKQDATDNTLETTDKTVSGAINEVKSGVADLEDWTSASTKSLTGNPITISDAAAVKAKALSMTIEPVQDLHGFDKPWVGGAGKNIMKIVLSNDSTSVAGMDFSHTDDTFTLQGTASSTFRIFNFDKVPPIKANLPYVLSVEVVGSLPKMQLSMYVDNGQGQNLGSLKVIANGAGKYASNAVTFNEDVASSTFTIEGLQADGVYDCTVKVQLEQNTQETDWSPYTNICPITGHTEASVQRDGRNLCDKGEGNVYNGGKLIPVSAGDKIYCYGEWVSDNKSFYGAIFSTPTETSKGNKIAILDDFYTGVSKEITISTNGYFGVCFDTSVESYTVSKMMISRTPIASASDYEPYQGKTYTIALGDTIYGGRVRIDSNGNTVMDVDRAVVDLGALTWTYNSSDNVFYSTLNSIPNCYYINGYGRAICEGYSIYNTSGSAMNNGTFKIQTAVCYIKNLEYTIASDLKTSLNGMKLCYILDDEHKVTIQLTPQQVQLLKGTNTLTANGSSISLTYQQDNLAGEILEQVEGQIDDLQGQIDEIPRFVEYSTTEQNTGKKWMGKDIYVKLVHISPAQTGDNRSFAHGIVNIDQPIGFYLRAFSVSDNENYVTMPFRYNETYCVMGIAMSQSNIEYSLGTSYSNFDLWAVCYYTKATT